MCENHFVLQNTKPGSSHLNHNKDIWRNLTKNKIIYTGLQVKMFDFNTSGDV